VTCDLWRCFAYFFLTIPDSDGYVIVVEQECKTEQNAYFVTPSRFIFAAAAQHPPYTSQNFLESVDRSRNIRIPRRAAHTAALTATLEYIGHMCAGLQRVATDEQRAVVFCRNSAAGAVCTVSRGIKNWDCGTERAITDG
jgi:hypothetical protein